jgi:hypothetical protein
MLVHRLREEDVKKACVQADSKGAILGPNQGEEQEDEVEMDIVNSLRKRGTRFFSKEKRRPRRPRTRLRRRPKRPREN